MFMLAWIIIFTALIEIACINSTQSIFNQGEKEDDLKYKHWLCSLETLLSSDGGGKKYSAKAHNMNTSIHPFIYIAIKKESLNVETEYLGERYFVCEEGEEE